MTDAPPVSAADVAAVPPLKVVNVLSMYKRGNAHVSNNALVAQFPHSEYNALKFAALIARQDRPITLLFTGGKAVCPGAASLESARLAVRDFTEMHLRAYMPVVCSDMTVLNIVMRAVAGFSLDLSAIAAAYPDSVSYRPSAFVILQFTVQVGEYSVGMSTSFRGCVTVKAPTQAIGERAWVWYYRVVLCAHRASAYAGAASSTYSAAKRRANDSLEADVRGIAERMATARKRTAAAAVAAADDDDDDADADAATSVAFDEPATECALPGHACDLKDTPTFLVTRTLQMERNRIADALAKPTTLLAAMRTHERNDCFGADVNWQSLNDVCRVAVRYIDTLDAALARRM